jgi:serine/threonine-protein kinase
MANKGHMPMRTRGCPTKRTREQTTRVEVDTTGEPSVEDILHRRDGRRVVLDGRYHLLRELGRGGMAVVYLAEDLHDGRELAVKILDTGARDWFEALDGFLREAELARTVRHPNVVEMFGSSSTSEGVVYLTMEALHGRGLDQVIATERPTWPAIRAWMSQLCAALAAVHDAGVVHGDVKPSNCLVIDRGRQLRLVDFGNARPSGERSSGSASQVIGTPEYMSPEHVRGGAIDHRSDQYSVGVVLFELIAGRPPFRGDTPEDVFTQQLQRPVPTLVSVGTVVAAPAGVEAVIRRALAKRPSARFANVRALADALVAV